MTTVVKGKLPIMIPSAIQLRAGIKAGDHLEFKVSGGHHLDLAEAPIGR